MVEQVSSQFEIMENDPKKELKILQLGITKEYQEFQKLAASPLVKSGLNKIFDKISQKAFEAERKKLDNKNI